MHGNLLISNRVAGLRLILSDVASKTQGRELTNEAKQDLSSLAGGCHSVLLELEAILMKNSILVNNREGIKKLSQAAWSRFKWDSKKITELRGRITSNTSLLNAFATSRLRDDFADVQKLLLGVQLNSDQRESHEIAAWLSPLNFFATQDDVFSKRQEGTGRWLLESPVFREWTDGAKKTLWCPGIPGAGKTILASIAVNHLQTTFTADNISTVWIYCNYKEKVEQTLVNLLSSLLKQLIQKNSSFSKSVQDLHQKHRTRGTRPKLDEVVATLRSEIGKYSKTFIVVDALDEFSEEADLQIDLLAQLRALQGNVSLLVTSRYIASIQQEFEGVTRLDIRATDEDVSKYVIARISQGQRLSRHVKADPSLQGIIIDKIVSKAEGMFLLAKLYLDSLTSKNTRKAVRDTLEHLPTALDDVYAEAMTRIESQNEDDRELAVKVLTWICFSFRPLSVSELQHAIAVQVGERQMDIDALPDQEILTSVCAGLVTVEEKSTVVRLVHYTTQDYFERIRLGRFPNAHIDASMICLTYLCFDTGHALQDGEDQDDKEHIENRLQQNPFLDYAAKHWGDHARGQSEQTVKTLALNFLLDQAKVSASVEVLLSPTYNRNVTRKVFGIHLAAGFGLREMVQALLEQFVDPNILDSSCRIPLSWAVEYGRVETAKLLLENGAYIEHDGSDGRTPLLRAIDCRQERAARLLLDEGADVNRKNSYGSSSLHRAAKLGPGTMVELLLEHGADIESHNEGGGTPLHQAASAAASFSSQIGPLKVLLQAGAQISPVDLGGWTPLHYAIHVDAASVATLLDAGADFEARDVLGRTVLHFLGENAEIERIVQLLLHAGAEMDAKDVDGVTPLGRATRYGNLKLMQALLDNGADIEAWDDLGRTPMHIAAEDEHMKAGGESDVAAGLLLHNGAEIGTRDHAGLTPLDYAIRDEQIPSRKEGSRKVIRFLLSKGAVPSMPLASWTGQDIPDAVIHAAPQ